MKAKKTAPPRRRISFAVDRDEIEINSDWVEAVMRSPAPVAPVDLAAPAIAPFPAPPALFFAPEPNNATDAESATGAECTAVEESTAVADNAPVEDIAAVANQTPVEKAATVALSATVADNATGESATSAPFLVPPGSSAVADNATVEHNATGAVPATGAFFASTGDHRLPRRRPIHRVTDGLTPGQYSCYRLMYEAGEGTDGASHIYKGGYADLGRLTGLSKRGIQNIIGELQAKEVIRIHQQPGYHRTETTAYFVPDPDAVLHTWTANGWRYAVGKSKTLCP